MASPQVQGTPGENEDTSNNGTQTFTYPASIQPDELLLLVSALDGNQSVLAPPTDFTTVKTLTHSGNANSIYVFTKKATGLESGDGTWTTSGGERSTHVCYRISGAEDPGTQQVEVSTGAEGDSTSGDPDTVTPTGGPKDFLYIAAVSIDRGDKTVTGAPSGYGNLRNVDMTGFASGGVTLGTAEKETTGSSSDNPSAFTHGSDTWVAITIAVHPGAAGGEIEIDFGGANRGVLRGAARKVG